MKSSINLYEEWAKKVTSKQYWIMPLDVGLFVAKKKKMYTMIFLQGLQK